MKLQSGRALRRALILAALGASAVAALPAGAQAGGTVNDPPKVMTRNLYLGADLNPAIARTRLHAAAVLLRFRAPTRRSGTRSSATNFPARAKLLARRSTTTIRTSSGCRRSRCGEVVRSTSVKDANATVEYDFLQTLLNELAARGNKYTRRGRPAGGRHREPGRDVRAGFTDSSTVA